MDEPLESIGQELLVSIREANRHWQERVSREVLDIQYDTDADILYIVFGQPGDSFSVPIGKADEAMYLRVGLDDHRIVGVDIHGFRRYFLPAHQDAAEAFEPTFQFFGDRADWRVHIRLPTVGEAGQVTLFVPACMKSAEYFPRYLPKAAPQLIPA